MYRRRSTSLISPKGYCALASTAEARKEFTSIVTPSGGGGRRSRASGLDHSYFRTTIISLPSRRLPHEPNLFIFLSIVCTALWWTSLGRCLFWCWCWYTVRCCISSRQESADPCCRYVLPRTTEFKSRTPPVAIPVKSIPPVVTPVKSIPPATTPVKRRIPPATSPVKSSVPGNSRLTIPQELIEYIIDFLHDDIPTIRRCSLVSCAFLPRSRYHIYFNVFIVHTAELHLFRKQYAGQLYRSRKLLGLLARRPHIARLVTRFGMHAMSAPLFYEFMDTSFVSIISSLPNLSHLEFVARGNQGFWKELSITTHKPFVTALRSCSLKTFIFNGISFRMPRRFDDVFTAVANPALKHLSLACDSGADDTCRPFAPILPPPDGLPALLESLSICGAATTRNIKWLFLNQSLYNIRGIRRLSLQLCNKATSSLIQRLLDETQATLEDFTLDGSAWSWAGESLSSFTVSSH